MFAWNEETWGNARAAQDGETGLADLSAGMICGTKVATSAGWVRVEKVKAGDMVLTFDGGLQKVESVERKTVWALAGAKDTAFWPLTVPAGALGNREEMRVLPHQSVLIESDTAEEIFGDPFALIPAAALDGFRGIAATAPAPTFEVVTLHFARDEIVFANTGALFLCRRATDLMEEIFGEGCAYTVLSMDDADLLVTCLEDEDRAMGRAAPQYAAACAA